MEVLGVRLDPWEIAVIVAAAVVLIWRLVRGVHSWAQAGLVWLASLSGAVAIRRPEDAEMFVGFAVSALGVAGWFAFQWRQPETEPSPGSIAKARRLNPFPPERQRSLDRLQTLLLLYVMVFAFGAPILFIAGLLPGPLVFVPAAALVVGCLAFGYLCFRLLPRGVNPFERLSYPRWLWENVRAMVEILTERHPLLASDRGRPDRPH